MAKKSPWPQYSKPIPQLFYNRSRMWSNNTVFRYKKDGRWIDIKWSELENDVVAVASQLMAEGFKPRTHAAIISGNRPEWSVIDFATQSADVINVPVYPTNTADQVAYILDDSGAEMVFVEDQSQLDKIMAVKDKLPKLRKVVVIEDHAEKDDFVTDYKTFIEAGRNNQNRRGIDDMVAKIDPENNATLIYTSGTTGNPKGVMLSHRNMVSNIEAVKDFLPLNPGETDLQFLPICHSFGRMELYVFMMHGGIVSFAESIAKVPENLQEIKPEFFVTVPRLLEKVYEKILMGLDSAGPAKKKLFAWALDVGTQAVKIKLAGKTASLPLKLQLKVADKLVHSKIRGFFGGNIRLLCYAAAPLALDIQYFFSAAGITGVEAYGLTETAPGATGNTPGRIRLGSVGIPIKDTEVSIAADGEILIKGPQIMMGYWNKPEATAEALEGGWFHTGDIGKIDEDGYVYITDRKKDLIITAGGKNIAPQNIENLIKLEPAIEQIAVIGDKRKYLTALIVPSPDWLDVQMKENGFTGSQAEFIKSDIVHEQISKCVEKANKQLAKYETIKRFEILAEPFSVENDMLTPTMKVRRKNVMSHYEDMIDGMYK